MTKTRELKILHDSLQKEKERRGRERRGSERGVAVWLPFLPFTLPPSLPCPPAPSPRRHKQGQQTGTDVIHLSHFPRVLHALNSPLDLTQLIAEAMVHGGEGGGGKEATEREDMGRLIKRKETEHIMERITNGGYH